MKEQSTERVVESRPVWEGLEAFARQGVQDLLQRNARGRGRGDAGAPALCAARGHRCRASGYRNGYGKPRRQSLSVGTITLRRPRVRGLAERFESQLLPLFKRRTEAVGQLLPRLYLHGLALGDFDLALRGLLAAVRLRTTAAKRFKRVENATAVIWKTLLVAEQTFRLPRCARAAGRSR